MSQMWCCAEARAPRQAAAVARAAAEEQLAESQPEPESQGDDPDYQTEAELARTRC
jgi:hypothetical protein